MYLHVCTHIPKPSTHNVLARSRTPDVHEELEDDDLDGGERVLREMIYECERSLAGIEHARLELEARGWARARGLRE